jgi:ABC-type branched-subunit amino acid transport system ATPase component
LILVTLYFLPNGVAGILAKRRLRSADAGKPAAEARGEAGPPPFSFLGPSQSTTHATPVIEAEGVDKNFGGLQALRQVRFAVQPATVHALIGPNGAGKTTMINIISGFYRPDTGTIRMDGQPIDIPSMHAAARMGIARTFQTIKLFGDMTVLDHVRLGFERHTTIGLWDALARTRRSKAVEAEQTEQAMRILGLTGLAPYAHVPANALAYGHRRLVEIARALAVRPRLLLLDEPAAGLVAEEIEALKRLIATLRQAGVAILLVEHHMDLVISISDWITVLDYGEVIGEGTPEEVQRDRRVIEAYLGSVTDHALG